MRKIRPEMIEWLDKKLAGNGLCQEAIKIKDARTVFGCAVESCVGIYESGGNNNGPMVRLIQDTIGGADKEPWCMSFIQTCIAYAEEKTGIKSPIYASEHCMTVWRETNKILRVKSTPLRNAIIIWNYEGTDKGHTGMYLEGRNPANFTSIEGNTGADGSRDGDGIYIKKRNWYRSGRLVRVGFLKPFLPMVDLKDGT